MRGKLGAKLLNLILATAIVFGIVGFTANAAVSTIEPRTNTQKEEFNYVSLGASNVSGYGMHGYLYENVYETPLEKETNSLHGYKMNVPGTYPVLIRDRLSASYNVNFSQMAMSSMRAEELLFVLDESYGGDGYTDYWFFDTDGDGSSLDYLYTAGLYEWNNRKNAGVEGYDHNPTRDEVLATIRDEYTTAITNADLITIDIGMNNFGTYLGNPLEGNAFSSDLSNVSPELASYYDMAKGFILDIIKEQMAGMEIPEETISLFVDTFVYALVGYCVSLDRSIEKIYALNPDVEIVVVGVQNIADGLELALPGVDDTIPIGDIWGLVVNGANLYTAVLSPYSDSYYFADVCTEGHVEFFIDEIREYNGNPATLSQNMKDCFDLYESNFLLKTRILQMYAVQMSQMGFVSLSPEQMDMATTEGLNAFYHGFHYDVYPDKAHTVSVAGGTPLKEFLKMGEEGRLGGDAKGYYEMYEKMISVSYDVFAEIMREAARVDCIDLSAMTDLESVGASAFASVFTVLGSAIAESFSKQDYYFDINTAYPDGFFNTVAAEAGLPEGLLDSMLAFLLIFDLGSGFFSHPNAKGNEEACDIIMNAYTKGIRGQEVLADQMGIQYLPDEDSYYVAVSGTKVGYAEKFGTEIGLSAGQIGYTTWDELDYTLIDKADLVSLGFSENQTLGFATDQMLGYLANYISTDLRASLIDYIGTVIDNISMLSSVKDKIVGLVNNMVDEILMEETFAGKTAEELDWAEIVGEDQLPMVESIRSEIKSAVAEQLGGENYVVTIDIVEWISQNADSLGAAGALLKNEALLYRLFGDSAVFTIEIPIADAFAYATESYLYGYAKYTYDSTKLIEYINETNPDAKIIIMGSYNPIGSSYIDFGGEKINIGEVYSAVAFAYNAQLLAQYSASSNSTFIYLFEAESVYDEMVENGEASGDFMSFLTAYSKDKSLADINAEGNDYAVDQMLTYVRNYWDNHKYSNDCDKICNRCGGEREITHTYSDCEDTMCNVCSHPRKAVPHIYEHCEDTDCATCGKERAKGSHSYSSCTSNICQICQMAITPKEHNYGAWKVTKEPTKDTEGIETAICKDCGHETTRSLPTLTDTKKNDGNGAVIGIIIGSALLICVAGFCIYWFVIRKKNTANAEESVEPDTDAEETKTEGESTSDEK